MALQSRLFRGDAKLEAAAVSDPAHVLPRSVGLHVGKIQVALLHLDHADIEASELQEMSYGPSTADAVLAYKQKRNIINRHYQTQADNIVGRMTIAALDRELLDNPFAGEPVLAPDPPSLYLRPQAVDRSRPALMLGFKVGAELGLVGGPQIVVPGASPLPPFALRIPVQGVGRFKVINGIGSRVSSLNNQLGLVFDPAEPKAHGGTMTVARDPHLFHVLGGSNPGQTTIVATDKARTGLAGLGSMLTLIVTSGLPAREATITFHFLGGPVGIATTRDRGSIRAAINRMIDIYEIPTGITFRFVDSGNAPLVIPEFANKKPPLIFMGSKRTPDWNAVTGRRSGAANINVFFTAKLEVVDASPFVGQSVALADTAGKPDFVARDIVMQDDLKGVDLGLALAHEAGHSFGQDDEQTPGVLMNPKAPTSNIPRAQAIRMNTEAGKL